MINFEQDLNSEQQKVVFGAEGPCLVLAGAGSGKTRTITYRVVYLLERGVKPENILLVTFTNKAAREMIERVGLLMGLADNFRLLWSGTFHHIGFKILVKYAHLLGYKNNPATDRVNEASFGSRFSVLDSEDSLNLLKICLKEEGIDRKERQFPSPAVLQDIISFSRNAETTIEDVLDLKHPHFLPMSETIVKIAEDYQKRKLEANAMDFDDLLVNWRLLLAKEKGIRNKFAEQFQYILVDEYQDTNKIQASIIDLLASQHRNLLVVGDDAQSIYSFRAADIQNILEFEKKYSEAKLFKLETNYRSTPDILNLANNIIANNLNQYEKNLRSAGVNFSKPVLQAFANQAEEAEFIAERIEEFQGEGIELHKIAVLFRAAYHSQALEMELVKRGIDYDYRGGVRFFERAHIKDTLAYLRIINNAEDAIAWRRVLNMQVGIGPALAERIIEYIRTTKNYEITKYKNEFENVGAILSAKAQVGWADFLEIWRKLNYIENKNPGDLIQEILDSKYAEYLENEYPDYRERLQDIEQLSRYAERYAERPASSADRRRLDAENMMAENEASALNTFLAEATLQEGFTRGQTQIETRINTKDKIILSTIHQAKGLEWEAVFVIGLSAGQFPNDRALKEDGGLEEERRLFYVAVTRAKKHLHLSYSFNCGFSSKSGLASGWGDFLSGPSMFIEEIDADLVDKSKAGGGSVFNERVEYVSEYEVDVRNTKDAKLRNNRAGGFLRSIDEL